MTTNKGKDFQNCWGWKTPGGVVTNDTVTDALVRESDFFFSYWTQQELIVLNTDLEEKIAKVKKNSVGKFGCRTKNNLNPMLSGLRRVLWGRSADCKFLPRWQETIWSQISVVLAPLKCWGMREQKKTYDLCCKNLATVQTKVFIITKESNHKVMIWIIDRHLLVVKWLQLVVDAWWGLTTHLHDVRQICLLPSGRTVMFVARPSGQLIELWPLFGWLVFMHANCMRILMCMLR